jgi:hypothetical protein
MLKLEDLGISVKWNTKQLDGHWVNDRRSEEEIEILLRGEEKRCGKEF